MASVNNKNDISILFDAGPMLDNGKTGVGYYVTNIIAAISNKYGNDITLDGYGFNFLGRHETVKYSQFSGSLKEIRFIPGKVLSLCRRLGFQPHLGLLVRSRYSHVFFTNYLALPVSKSTHVTVFIYDLGFMDHPEFMHEVNLKVQLRFLPASMRRADTIVTISEFTKQRIQHHFPDIKATIVVTPIPPVTLDNKTSTPLNSRLKELGIKDKKYFLYLGTLEPRKNLVLLIQAFMALPESIRSEYSLILAGGRGWKDSEINNQIDQAVTKGVPIITTGYVSESEKEALYGNALSFVMPSHYEGFGMPILEAMTYNIPVIVSDIPVFREVAKDAVLYFDKDSVTDISEKMIHIIKDLDLQKQLVEQGNILLKSFAPWSKNAETIINAIKR